MGTTLSPYAKEAYAITQPLRATYTPTVQYAAGTIEDPHVFVGLVRDHRGLRDPEDRRNYDVLYATLQNAARVASPGVPRTIAELRLQFLIDGNLPFETFTNLADNATWGKFYDAASGILIIKPVPVHEGWWSGVKNFVKSIGDAIVWFGEQTLKTLTVLCAKFNAATEGKKDDYAIAAIGYLTGPDKAAAIKGGIKTAKYICQGVSFVNALLTSGGTAGEEAVRDWTRVPSRRATGYPSGAFVVYDPTSSTFHVLVPVGVP